MGPDSDNTGAKDGHSKAQNIKERIKLKSEERKRLLEHMSPKVKFSGKPLTLIPKISLLKGLPRD
jgi:hypothetical protein